MMLDQAQKIYMIGIKGVGMTGLAQLLQAQGKTVWGSDVAEDFFTSTVLKRHGLECFEGFSESHLERPIDLIIYSSAWVENSEIRAAKARNIPMLSYAEALGEFTKTHKSIAVAGSHGKTTTTALLAHVLQTAGLNPIALVGSRVMQFEGNALLGGGDIFIFEADEYQNKFQYYFPFAVVLTSVDWDHPDFYPTPQEYNAAFINFMKRLPADGFAVACYDDEEVKKVITEAGLSSEQLSTYGLRAGFWQMVRMWLDEGRWHFSVKAGEEFHGNFGLKLIGSHNVQNALAVIACAQKLGIDMEAIRTALASFEGTARRFQIKGKLTNGVTVVDDYAHHPNEIKNTLKAARAFYPYKIIRTVFQPHTFSRTQALLAGFASAFDDSDEVIILETYASARENGRSSNTHTLVEEVRKKHPKVVFFSTIQETVDYLVNSASRSDAVITMGAGDVWQVGDELIKKFGTVEGRDHSK